MIISPAPSLLASTRWSSDLFRNTTLGTYQQWGVRLVGYLRYLHILRLLWYGVRSRSWRCSRTSPAGSSRWPENIWYSLRAPPQTIQCNQDWLFLWLVYASYLGGVRIELQHPERPVKWPRKLASFSSFLGRFKQEDSVSDQEVWWPALLVVLCLLPMLSFLDGAPS